MMIGCHYGVLSVQLIQQLAVGGLIARRQYDLRCDDTVKGFVIGVKFLRIYF